MSRPSRPRPSRRPRLALAGAALAALTLAACGNPADSATDEGGDDDREVTHARGEATVPADPQRVVVLEPVQLDTAVALGMTPVGAAVLNEAAGVPAYLGDDADDVQTVGTVTEPDVDKIAALRPDLIIGTETRHSALYDQLSDVAPTVYMASQSDPWQDNVRFTAAALGDPEGADELLEGYQERCDEIAAEFDTEGRTAQLVRPRDGLVTLYGPTSFAGATLECAGFTTPERPEFAEEISVDLSPERVLEAQADLVLVTTTDVEDESTIPPSITANAASFPELHLVDQSFWITGVGPLGGQTVLDDLERILSGS
ncbi:iron-siderophore ABC transporter substrate-binding protein [Nocardioides zeae]|uniref:Iron-siderophore ABC transporter substrate-binding protein n=1 Tax=Nocardioides imazamoxiresistens TaxID=3231893 RepID=A0ABU3PYB7_9ACTN|nr:iron-siderophore ABC transporter substrate-binding protein [Nocardioides zeae]MDT9594247.1 iron-siderophore ABC transporter substrate-binding protein [Nocardioides zeae]